MQADVGIAFAHRVNKRHPENGGGAGGHTDADVAGKARLARGENRIIGVTQRELRLGVEGEAGAGRHYAARRPLQQANGEFVLQARHLLAKRGDADIQVKRGAAHTAGFNNTHKIA